MAELLHANGAGKSARLQFRILSGEEESVWTLATVRKRWQVGEEEVERPDSRSSPTPRPGGKSPTESCLPFRAFLQGKMRVRGNIELGKRVLGRIASAPSASTERGAK